MPKCMNAEVIFTSCQAAPYANFFLSTYIPVQVANVVKPNYTLPTFAHMYAHAGVFFPKPADPPCLSAGSAKGKTKSTIP